MQLHAVIVPPPDVLESTFAAAQGVRLAPETPIVQEEAPARLLQRLRRRETAPARAPEVPFTLTPSTEQHVRVTRFGNVTGADTETLGIALGMAAWDWPAPVVHVSGLSIDTTAHTPVITAQLDGDIDGLRQIFRGVLAVAQSQRFFLDRRIFHPEFTVATVDIASDETAKERLELETETVRGADWQVTHLSLLRLSFTSPGRVFEDVAVVPLGGSAG